MTASVPGSQLLLLTGVAFLCAGIVGWRRASEDRSRARRVIGLVIDLLVGLVALAEGTVSVIGEAERIVVWSIGSAALVVSAALLVVRGAGRCASEPGDCGEVETPPSGSRFERAVAHRREARPAPRTGR